MPSVRLVALPLTMVLLAGCSPAALQAVLGDAVQPPTTSASTAPSARPSASTAPTASTAPSTAPSSNADASAFMAAVDAASSEQPEQVARLLITGLVTYDTDEELGRAMMAYTMRSGLVQQSSSSPTGVLPQTADEIYFRTLDRNTKLGSYYLDAPASAALSWEQMATHVVVDKEYKAVDQGLSADGKMWTFYMKVTGAPTEVRSRPVRLQMDGDRGWRVSNYSSIMVQP